MTMLDELVPSALDCRKRIAEVEGLKASEDAHRIAAAEAEKRALLEQLTKPSGVSDEDRMARAATIIKRAVDNGLTEVEVGRFPNKLCTDGGRAINQQEAGWERTLTGLPRELFAFWQKYLQPKGYKIKYQIVDFPGGMPGDIAISLNWQGQPRG